MEATSRRLLLATTAVIALLAFPSLARAADHGYDGIPDRCEPRHGLSLEKEIELRR